jgi:hypothetical protein
MKFLKHVALLFLLVALIDMGIWLLHRAALPLLTAPPASGTPASS